MGSAVLPVASVFARPARRGPEVFLAAIALMLATAGCGNDPTAPFEDLDKEEDSGLGDAGDGGSTSDAEADSSVTSMDSGLPAVSVDTVAPADVASGSSIEVLCEFTDALGNVTSAPADAVTTVANTSVLQPQSGSTYVGKLVGVTTATCSGGGLTDATPASITVTTGGASSVAIALSRTSVVASPSDPGTNVTCTVKDANGNPIPAPNGATIVLNDPGAGTISGPNVTFTKTGTQTVSCAVTGVPAASANVTVSAAPAASVTIALSRTAVIADPTDLGTDVNCTVKDASGNVIPQPNGSTVSLGDATAGTVSGTNAKFTKVGSQVVRCDVAGIPSASANVTVSPGNAASVSIALSRSTVIASPSDPGTAVTCTVEDANGNVLPSPDGSTISLGDPSAGTVFGSSVAFTKTGVQAVRCDVAGIPSATANVTVNPGSAASVSIALSRSTVVASAADPGSNVTCTVEDGYGNVISPNTATISLGDATAGTISGSTVKLTKAGTQTVLCNVTGLASASASLLVTPGSAASVSIALSRTTVLVNDAGTDVTCTVKDSYGNTIAPPNGSSIVLGDASETLSGTNVKFSATGTHAVSCAATGVASSATANVTVNAGVPTSVSISVSRTTVAADPADAGTVVTCTATGGGADVNGTISLLDPSAGTITGNTVKLTRVGVQTIVCSFGTLTPATANVTVTPGSAKSVEIALSRTTVAADPADAGTVATCTAKDAYGNVVPGAPGVSVVLGDSTAGTLSGTTAKFTRTGPQTIGCALSGASTAWANVTVIAGRPATITLTVWPMETTYFVGDTVTATVTAYDTYGNLADTSAAVVASNPSTTSPAPLQFTFQSPGTFTLTATIPGTATSTGSPIASSVMLQVNDGAPSIGCTASMIKIDGTVGKTWAATRVTGTVADASGLQSVTVNGVPVTLGAGGTYTANVASVYGVNAYRVVATDNFGLVRERWCGYIASDTYQPEATPMPGSISLALGQTALDDNVAGPLANSLGDLIDRALPANQFSSLLDAYLRGLPNNMYLGQACFILCANLYYNPSLYSATVDAGSDIDLNLSNAGLTSHLVLQNLKLGIRSAGLLLNSTGTVTVQHPTADADWSISTVNLPPRVLDSTYVANSYRAGDRGSMNVSVNNALVDLVASIFPGLIDKILNNVIQTVLAQVLDDVLHALTVSNFGIDVSLPKLDGSGNISIAVGGDFVQGNANTSRLFGSIAPTFTATGGTDRPDPAGYLGIPVQNNPVTALDPALNSRSFALALHAEALETLAVTLWQRSYFDGALSPTALANLGINLGDLEELVTGFNLAIASPLPPVIEVRSDGKLNIGLAGMHVYMMIPGEPTPIDVELTARMVGTAALTTGPNPRIQVSVDPASAEIHTYILSAPDSLGPSVLPMFEEFVGEFATQLISQVLGNSLIGIPVPTLNLGPTIGPLSLGETVTLELQNPVLTVESGRYLVIRSELIERP